MDSNGFCNYEKFRTNGIVYYPGNEDELCQDTKSKRTSFNPDEYETKATSTVTLAPVAFILLLLQVIIS
ncbi:unnamed protein product [Brugia pahangi]|uniref:Uncharacterized protein n=1 Tax=Brugia pahangi TaxID=6280 RepID=A0A0N4T5S2_BRUPA|nr:unnamed protein product [Brugia pahangi]